MTTSLPSVAHHGLTALAAALLGLSGCHKQQPTTPPAATTGETTEANTEPAVDSERMLGLLETLASDDLGGRFTLSADIVSSAKLVTEQWSASGVQPVGDGYTVPFSLVTWPSRSCAASRCPRSTCRRPGIRWRWRRPTR